MKLDAKSFTKETILERNIFDEILSIYDEVEREYLIGNLKDIAKDFGVKSKFDNLLKAALKMHKQTVKTSHYILSNTAESMLYPDAQVQLEPSHPILNCGKWYLGMDGIRTPAPLGGTFTACHHPVVPIKRLVNIDTDTEKMTIAFNKGEGWSEKTFDKTILSSATRIQALSAYGVLVSSENSKHLVNFLNDIEAYNIHYIPKRMSTSRMGWLENYSSFMPFDNNEIVFDGENSFKDSFESISRNGSAKEHFELLKEIRSRDRIEPILCIASSLASVLVEPCGVLPFIFHLFGEGGKGKTIATMLAASMWGNPNESGYIADPKSSATGFESLLNFLNNMPFICDDLSKIKTHLSSQKYGDYSDFIYFLCGGTGKRRSNINLGVNKIMSWKNCSITNAEKPITSEISNGGELLRVIEVKSKNGIIFDDGKGGKKTADNLRKNYGFVGKEFIKILIKIGWDEIKRIQARFENELDDMDKEKQKEGKQLIPMALILTAEEIFSKYIMKDCTRLRVQDCFNLIRSNSDMNDMERAYEFVINEVGIHRHKFTNDGFDHTERWGYLYDSKELGSCVLINPNIFKKISTDGNFNKKMFVEWATDEGKSLSDNGRTDKKISSGKINGRFVMVKLPLKDNSVETPQSPSVKSSDQFEFNQGTI